MAGLIEKILAFWGYEKREAQSAKSMAESVLALLAQGDPVPPKAGRSSEEDFETGNAAMGTFMQDTAGLNPVVPFETLEFLTKVALINPDLNHATTNLINLANNGHSLALDAASDAIIEKAHERLNERAQNLYPRSAGIDGLINHYIAQIAITGAISSEDVVSKKRDGVERVAMVPTQRIRFKYLDGEYKPFQLLRDGKLIELNEQTYSYYAFRTAQNSPYAIPLYLAAVENILAQRDMQTNLNFIMRKFGLLGLVALTLKAQPKKPAESDGEHSARKERYLAQVLTALQKNFLQGLMVKFEDQTLEHHNITGEASGSKDVWDLNEQQIASGMGIDPMIIGRVFSTTETFANVTYMFSIRQANNIRRLVKRRIEKTYRLDLRLQGLELDDLSLQFEENPARDPQSESIAVQRKQRGIIEKVKVGVISPDDGAQELGYENWFDVKRLDVESGLVEGPDLQRREPPKRFLWNAGLQRYRFVRPRVFLAEDRGSQIVDRKSLAAESTVRKVLEDWSAKYLKAIAPFLGASAEEAGEVLAGFVRRSQRSDFVDEKDFAEQAFGVITSIYVDAFRSTEAQNALRDSVKVIYEYYRLEDTSAFEKVPKVTFTLDKIDTRTLNFVRGLDRHYLSKFIFNADTERQVLDWLRQQWIENGEGLFGRTSREAIRTFQALAVDTLEPLSEYQAQRIINTSVQRMRTWAQIGQLDEAEFSWAKVYNPEPEAEICQAMNGRLIPIGEARKAVDELSKLTPEQYQKRLQPITAEDIGRVGIRAATRQGIAFPPYHPNCKTRLLATTEKGNESLGQRAERMAFHRNGFAKVD